MQSVIKLPLLFSLLFVEIAAAISAQAQHDRAFWRSIAANNYAVPQHQSADTLSFELSSLLASADPELRDDLAYSILARWIHRPNVLAQSTLVKLADSWTANLKDGIGEDRTNSVLKRSFSALCLASIAKREAGSPFLGAQRYHQLVADTVTYLRGERDLRGYDAKLHWIHATAHTADLLAGLAGSSQLTGDEATAILAAISARLTTAPEVFTQGEQDRLAAAVLAVVRRPEFQETKFEQWLSAIQDEDRDIWTKTTPEALARYQNHNYLLQALAVRLALEPESQRTNNLQQKVLAALKGRLD